MSYTLKPALPEDAEEIAQIMQASTTLLPRIAVEYASVPQAEYLAWNTACLRSDFTVCGEYPAELCALKAVQEGSGQIAGYAIWGWTARAMSLISQARAHITYPKQGNTDLHTAFYSRLRTMEAKHKPAGEFYSLLFLLTSPAHQRKGIALRLVNHGLEHASASPSHVPVFLSASPMGLPLYTKLGFRELDRIEVDLGQYGWEGTEEERVHVHVAMIKDAETKDA